MTRVLITGGAGFIGCRLARRLLDAGHEVDVLDNLHPQVHVDRAIPAALPPGVRFLPGDVTASDVWDAVLAATAPDTIVHLAAETGTGQSLTHATRHACVNVVGTAAMVEALERSANRPTQLVLASSRAVYGDGAWAADSDRGDPPAAFYPGQRPAAMLAAGHWDHRTPTGAGAHPVPSRADRTRPDPTNVYAATKLAQEHVLSAWCAARDVELTVLRLQNVYGPGQSVGNPYTGVLTLFARTALDGGVIDVYEDGAIVRDFVFVDDVAHALSAAVVDPATRTLDVGSGSTDDDPRGRRHDRGDVRSPGPEGQRALPPRGRPRRMV